MVHFSIDLGRMFAHERRRRLRAAWCARPKLERLEDRTVPAVTYDWVGGNPGDPNAWEEARNWINGVPGQFPGSNASNDIAEFLGANAQATCDLTSSRTIGALKSDDAFNLALWVGTTQDITLTVQYAGTATDWHGGDIGLLTTGTTLELKGNGTTGTATFSGSTQNSSGRLNPSGNGGALGSVVIYNNEAVTFQNNFSLFGANITIGKVVGQAPTPGNLTFASSLASNVTDDRDANITIRYSTLIFSGAAAGEAAGGIVDPTSGPYAGTGGIITLDALIGAAGPPFLIVGGSGIQVRSDMPVQNYNGQVQISANSTFHITGYFTSNNIPYSYDQSPPYFNVTPRLDLDTGSTLSCYRQFRESKGYVEALNTVLNATIKATAFTFDGGNVSANNNATDVLKLDGGDATVTSYLQWTLYTYVDINSANAGHIAMLNNHQFTITANNPTNQLPTVNLSWNGMQPNLVTHWPLVTGNIPATSKMFINPPTVGGSYNPWWIVMQPGAQFYVHNKNGQAPIEGTTDLLAPSWAASRWPVWQEGNTPRPVCVSPQRAIEPVPPLPLAIISKATAVPTDGHRPVQSPISSEKWSERLPYHQRWAVVVDAFFALGG